MKKRVLTLILAAFLCVSTVLTLTSCGEHTFKTDWEKDATHHWHACEDADCTEVAEKAEHTFDEGKETTFATDTENGVMTYTCTVCGQTKTEATTFDGVNITQYGEAVYDTTLQNVTVTITLTSGSNTAESVLKLNMDEYSHIGNTLDGAVNVSGENADTAAALRSEYLFFAKILYKYLSYDAESKIYNVSNECTVPFTDEADGTETTYKSITMTLSGNRIQTVDASFEVKQEGAVVSSGTIKLALSEYNTTEVVITPGAPEDEPEEPTDPETPGGSQDPGDFEEHPEDPDLPVNPEDPEDPEEPENPDTPIVNPEGPDEDDPDAEIPEGGNPGDNEDIDEDDPEY